MLTAKSKIHMLDWTKARKPISHSKLAHEIARKLDRYLTHMTVRSYHHQIYFTDVHSYIIENYS